MPILEADFCQTVQQDLADIAGRNYGAIQRTPTGFLSAALSDANTSGFPEPYMLDMNDGKGKKQVLIEMIQPSSISTIVTEPGDVCEPGTPKTKTQYLKSITKFAGTSNLTFTKAAMRRFCERPAEWRAKVILSEMDALFRKINQIAIGQYVAGVGGFYGGVAAAKEVQMLENTGAIRQSDPNGEVAIMQDFQDLGYTMQPILVGAGNLDTYTKLANIGCCNAYGQDIGDTAGSFAYYRDRDVDAVIGDDNNVLAFTPGAVQFVSWNENEGDFAMEHEHFAETTIVDPITGLTLDMEMNYDRCTKTWVILFFLNFDLFTLPLTMFPDLDERDGTNGTFHYVATQAEPVVVP